MTNFEKIKNDWAKLSKLDLAKEIMARGEQCDCCVYDNYVCSGTDCEWGVMMWLDKEADV